MNSIPDTEVKSVESMRLIAWTVEKRKVIPASPHDVCNMDFTEWELVSFAPTHSYDDAVQFLWHMVMGYHHASMSRPFDGIPPSKRGWLSKDATYYRGQKKEDGSYWEYAVLPMGDTKDRYW